LAAEGLFLLVAASLSPGFLLAETYPRDNLNFVARRIKDQQIVIVEDDRFIKEALEDHFQEHNQVLAYSNAEDALDAQAKFEEANVFIIDYKLPRKNGVELFQYLRLRFPQAKYILITGEMNYEMADNTRKLGPDALMLKPFDFTILEDNISTLVATP
jgi:DNA-binding NarL/FixJ family response regulator